MFEEEEIKYQRVATEPQDDTQAKRYLAVPVSMIAPLTDIFDNSPLPSLVPWTFPLLQTSQFFLPSSSMSFWRKAHFAILQFCNFVQIVDRFFLDDDERVCEAAARCLLAAGAHAIRYWALDLEPEEVK